MWDGTPPPSVNRWKDIRPMSQATNPTSGSSIERTIRNFAHVFGVRSDDVRNGGGIRIGTERDDDRMDDILYDQGAIIEPASVVGLYWDIDHYDPPGSDVIDSISEVPKVANPGKHNGVPVVEYISEDGKKTLVSRDYVDKAAELYGVDPVENVEVVRMVGNTNDFPLRINDPTGETFLLIAPRIR